MNVSVFKRFFLSPLFEKRERDARERRMLRRKPTRIELKQEDIEELVAVRKEHMEQQKQVSLFARR